MVRNPFGIGIKPIGFGFAPQKKKRVQFTPSQKLYIWEHPKKYGRKCSICDEKITKQSDLQFDHTHPYSKSGKKQNLAHGHCNRMKGSGSLGKIQRTLDIKSKTKRSVRKKKTRRSYNPLAIRMPQIRIPRIGI